jgi:hypothetical protein
VLLVLFGVAHAASAQQQPTQGSAGSSPPSTVAVHAGSAAPTVDGRLADEIWASAPASSDFTQVLPTDGSAPSERSLIRVVYDDDALYVAARMFDSEPEGVVGRLGRRDSETSSDLFFLSIDSYHDHRTAFRFGVNPAGVRSDWIATNDSDAEDPSWDPVWSAATSRDSLGWIAELRIPFSQLRFSSADEQTWGINFTRLIFRKNEWVVWSWWPNTEQGFTSHFGHLDGLRNVPAPRRLEILPYTVAKSDYTEGADPANPFNDGSVYDITGGLDLKYGVTTDLTLDATINPDFGQVEADPAVVNLTAFETFFEERRPFFVEGANLFQFGAGSGGFVFGAPQLFYSRRIGRSPSRSAYEPGGYVDNPTSTRILGATKLSGQTGGWSIGLMDAVTSSGSARIQRTDGTRTSEPVEPVANYGVLSLRKDLRGGASGIGVLATTVNRRIDDPLFDDLRSSAFATGVDFFHRLAGNRFAVSGTLAASHIRGDSTAITGAQRSSARYYQRPDQNYVSLDPGATSMTGLAASMQVGKVAGSWTYGSDFFAYSPGFEVNDAGFQTETDRIFHGLRLSRRWLTPGKVFQRAVVNVSWGQSWNFGGERQTRQAALAWNGTFHNYWFVGTNASYNFTSLSDRSTRGGPLTEFPSSWSTALFVGSDGRKPVSVFLVGFYARNKYDGWGGVSEVNLTIRPTGAVNLSVGPTYNKTHSIGFYVTQRSDPTATATYGGRYIYSELVQTTLDATIRADVAITPDLSIQLYAQPFLASGDYQRFKELATPREYDFIYYGEDGNSTLSLDSETNVYTVDTDGPGSIDPINFYNPDFRFRSLRSNLVVRWEYTPGSTLFLVWNRGQSGYDSDPTFNAFDELGNLLRDDQQNTFVVKLNYWLSR